jgi:predicted Zn-dependent peptidase
MPACFGVYTAVTPTETPTCIALIMDQIRRLKEEPVSMERLEDAKEFIKGNLLMAAESPDNQMVRLAQNEFIFGQPISIQSVIDQIDSVAAGDLLALAKELWARGCAALTMVGPDSDKTDCSSLLSL